MGRLSTFLDEKHKCYFVVIETKHNRTYPSFDITHTSLHRVK